MLGKKKITSKSFTIKIPLMVNENNKRVPGSLGYGFYTYIDGLSDARELAYEYSHKFKDEPIFIFKIVSNIEGTNLLDLNEDDSKNAYRSFYKKVFRSAENICKNKHFKINNKKQHVFDGVVLELYVQYLMQHKHIVVKGIIHDTVTYIHEDGLSDIENGREFCIRSRDIIKELSEDT